MKQPLNLILLVVDSLRADHLGCYGNLDVGTPNLDRLARESVRFTDAHACSFPTLPCRIELLSGKFTFARYPWGPFPDQEVPVAERLRDGGFHTALITDNLPMARKNHRFERGYDSRVSVRGQWYDQWAPCEGPVELPAPAASLDQHERVRQYLHNVRDRATEADYFAPRVMRASSDWLTSFGKRGRFFLHLECFDPHEPWDPPAGYTDPKLVGPHRIIYPHLGRASRYSPAELASIRELYAGEVRMVDRWIGTLLDTLDREGLADTTALLMVSDHGIFLGEHDLLGKANHRREDVNGWPPYREVSHIPLMLRVPGLSPGTNDAFVHPGDLMPTLMELAGLPIPEGVTASSLMPIARGEAESGRGIAVTAWSYRGWRRWHPTCIRDREWSMVWWRTGIPPRLHHLPTDPTENTDLYPAHRTEARRLHREYVRFLKAQPRRPRNYWSRRFFPPWN